MIGKELGNYHVLEMIGKGGMAIVYKGRHKTLSRRIVAIKMLSASLEEDASFSERFFREAEVMDRLRHPNIVTLYDFIEDKGHYYIVMEYVAGMTLSEIIKEAGGPLNYDEIRAIFQQVLAGIGHAHRLGIVHRDLKPGNIMINEEGEVKITDFGIARLLGNNFEATLTTTGLGIGSPYYMSPEQVLASKEHPITGASDIYSLGITLYQTVTGKLPFEGADSLFTIMQSHVKKSPPRPREIVPAIPAPLEEVILKSIQKKTGGSVAVLRGILGSPGRRLGGTVIDRRGNGNNANGLTGVSTATDPTRGGAAEKEKLGNAPGCPGTGGGIGRGGRFFLPAAPVCSSCSARGRTGKTTSGGGRDRGHRGNQTGGLRPTGDSGRCAENRPCRRREERGKRNGSADNQAARKGSL